MPTAYAMPGWVSESFLSSVLAFEDRPRALLQSPFVDSDRLAAIEKRVREATLPGDVTRAVTEALEVMRGEGVKGFAVRSSAVHEDQEGASAAGMHVSHLNLLTDQAVLDAVRAAWAGIFRPRTIAYLRSLPDDLPVGVGVVVQAVVDAEVSGVMFTANPLTGDANEVVINAAYGLGSPVCDGRVSPDTYRVDKFSGDVRDRVIGDKALAMRIDARGGTREEKVSTSEQEAYCLEDTQLFELRVLAERLENHFGTARDVE